MNFFSKYSFLLLLILLFPVKSYSTVCLTINSIDCSQSSCPDQYYDEVVLFPNVDIELCSSTDCGNAVAAAVSVEQAKAIYAGGNCQVFDWFVQEGCGVAKAHVQCDASWIANQPSTTRVDSGVTVVDGVTLGAEDAAAAAVLDSFLTGLGDCVPITGYVLSQVQKGVSSTSYAYDGQAGVSVVASPFRRCRYTRAGSTMVPLDDLIGSGGSGSSGLSYSETVGAITEGLAGAESKLSNLEGYGLSQSTSLTDIKGLLQGGIGGGLTQGEAQVAFEGAINSSGLGTLSGGSYGVGDGTGRAVYGLDEGGLTYSSIWSDFSSSVISSDLGGLANSFFSDVPVEGTISAPSLSINGGASYGVHSFDFTYFDTLLAILKPCIIIAFSFVAVRLVVVKGAS